MKVSVIVPTYKPGTYIRECILSIINQTLQYSDYEVIIVLNGDCEPYYSQIEQLIRDYNNCVVRTLYTEYPGVSNARNIGMKEAKGEYICFIDDDDYISPSYLESLLENASNNTIPVCRPLEFIDGTNDYRPYDITRVYDKNVQKKIVPFFKASKFFNGPVYKLIHREIIANREFDTRFRNGEDSLFMFEISDKIKFVRFADAQAIYYRRLRNGSATKSQKSFIYKFKNYTLLIVLHFKLYIFNITKYNMLFFIRSILGRVKSIILD